MFKYGKATFHMILRCFVGGGVLFFFFFLFLNEKNFKCGSKKKEVGDY